MNTLKSTISKNDKVLVQTPQLCNYKILKNIIINTNKIFEDETSIFLHNSMEVIAIEGDPLSLKITYEKDLNLLEPHLIKNSNNQITKIGNGFDIHRFDNSRISENNFILLGGIKIKASKKQMNRDDRINWGRKQRPNVQNTRDGSKIIDGEAEEINDETQK